MALFSRKRRLVRLHQADPEPSWEGILVAQPNGFYELRNAKLVEAPDRSFSIGDVWVPRERVMFVQLL